MELAGPGIITSFKEIAFSKVGRYYLNIEETTEAEGFLFGGWAAFDGSTNAPVVFPTGASIREIEKLALRGR